MPGSKSKAQTDACGGDDATQKCPLKAKLTITVRMAFYNPVDTVECLIGGDPIVGATIFVDGQEKKNELAKADPGTTKDNVKTGLPPSVLRWPKWGQTKDREVGIAVIDISDLADGKHYMQIDPPGTPASAPADADLKDLEDDASAKRPTYYRKLKHHEQNAPRFRPVYIKFFTKGLALEGEPQVIVGKPLAKGSLVPLGAPASRQEEDPRPPIERVPPPGDAEYELVSHARVVKFSTTAIHVDWKPDWMQSTFKHKTRPDKPRMVVIHRTSGEPISGAIQQSWTPWVDEPNPETGKKEFHGWHYLMDHDGHITKFVDDDRETDNAGPGRWAGEYHVNGFLIGIEIVPHLEKYEESQYVSLIRLIKHVQERFDMPPYLIAGHADVDIGNDDMWINGGSRDNDPGLTFEWQRLEAEGLGMIPASEDAVPKNQGWARYFDDFKIDEKSPPSALLQGDHDDEYVQLASSVSNQKDRANVLNGSKTLKKQGNRWGKKARTGDLTGVIKGLQQDLIDIGYSVPAATGNFDKYTASAVNYFKRHFFAGGRGEFPSKGDAMSQVDDKTAHWIQRVAAGVRTAAAAFAAKASAAGASPAAGAGTAAAAGSAPAAAPAPTPAPAPAAPKPGK